MIHQRGPGRNNNTSIDQGTMMFNWGFYRYLDLDYSTMSRTA